MLTHWGVAETVVPGAVMSGLKRPSVVGPMEEKYARLSNRAAQCTSSGHCGHRQLLASEWMKDINTHT